MDSRGLDLFYRYTLFQSQTPAVLEFGSKIDAATIQK